MQTRRPGRGLESCGLVEGSLLWERGQRHQAAGLGSAGGAPDGEVRRSARPRPQAGVGAVNSGSARLPTLLGHFQSPGRREAQSMFPCWIPAHEVGVGWQRAPLLLEGEGHVGGARRSPRTSASRVGGSIPAAEDHPAEQQDLEKSRPVLDSPPHQDRPSHGPGTTPRPVLTAPRHWDWLWPTDHHEGRHEQARPRASGLHPLASLRLQVRVPEVTCWSHGNR